MFRRNAHVPIDINYERDHRSASRRLWGGIGGILVSAACGWAGYKGYIHKESTDMELLVGGDVGLAASLALGYTGLRDLQKLEDRRTDTLEWWHELGDLVEQEREASVDQAEL
jgi:hypothetical protein